MCSKGLPREPKYSHLTKLHKVIKLCEPALVSVDPTVTSLGDKQEVINNKLQSKSNTNFKDYLPFCLLISFFFRLMCSNPSHLALLSSQTTTLVLLQESPSGELHMIYLLGLSVFCLTAKPSITTLQR